MHCAVADRKIMPVMPIVSYCVLFIRRIACLNYLTLQVFVYNLRIKTAQFRQFANFNSAVHKVNFPLPRGYSLPLLSDFRAHHNNTNTMCYIQDFSELLWGIEVDSQKLRVCM